MPASSTLKNKLDLKLKVIHQLNQLKKLGWDDLIDESDPFLESSFLESLENAGCIGLKTSWQPHFLLFFDNREQKLVAGIPLFVRFDSYGEFVFDWAWADFYQRYGVNYYPKASVCVPFSPINSPRFLIDKNFLNQKELIDFSIQKTIAYAQKLNLSSLHFLFLKKQESESLKQHNFLTRNGHQYHWQNQNYQSFDDFLLKLKRKRRSQVKKERNQLNIDGIEFERLTGDQITSEKLKKMIDFYLMTIVKKRSHAYLNEAFFLEAFKQKKDQILLVLAKKEGQIIAGSFNFFKGKKLYGRYWGCIEEVEFLHFECCYYQLIEFAIERKLEIIEAGAQGEHKFLRGFEPYPTFSCHFIFDPNFSEPIKKAIHHENQSQMQAFETLCEKSPLKN